MQARRAARELLLILFSQFNKQSKKLNEDKITEIVLKSVRTLVNDAYEDLKITSSSLLDMQNHIDSLETDNPENLERPIGVANLPVPIPLTSDMSGRVNALVDVADKSFNALEIAELSLLAQSADVKKFIVDVAKAYQENQDAIKELIKENAIGWDTERIVKIDKDIMKIALTELLYAKDAPVKVIIDEALELAKKYSTDESASFINGIIGQVVKKKELKD